MPKLVISARSFGLAHPPALQRVRDMGFEVVECREGPGLDSGRLHAAVADADIWVLAFHPAPEELLAASPRLKGIIKHGVGLDNVDIPAATRLGIPVLTAPGATEHAVPEHSLGLLFALARHILDGHAQVVSGEWRRSVGTGIHGKTMGILGLGRIGSNLAHKASGFGLRILGHDPLAGCHVPGVEPVPLDHLLAQSDFIMLCAPLTAETRNLFDASILARCKPGVLIVNCARGEIVDETALADALHRGHVGGYGADVFHQEPPRNSPLLRAPRTVFSPHSASYSESSLRLMGERVADGVHALLHGRTPEFLMNPGVRPRPFAKNNPSPEPKEKTHTT